MAEVNRGMGVITETDCYLFGQGTHYEIYKKLGAHPMTRDGVEGYYFAVWAPHARAVSVVGEFNDWQAEANPCAEIFEGGIWECFIPGLKAGMLYKFLLKSAAGELLYKADPYARAAEFRPGTASQLTGEPWDYRWKDRAWMQQRAKQNPRQEALSIYECHLGSWRRGDENERDGFLSYETLARELSAYVKDMGYTHVELMGIAEYPFDGSWGYQVTGYYAPTSRYGSPAEFQAFVDTLHAAGIGVILDWVPAHFPRDAFGLADFDGQALYEYADSRKGEHPDWGTKVFDYGKTEVKNFLIANALYWMDEYHVDGLRVDAVASMLYLDYGRQSGQWCPNKYGGNENLEAIEFFKHLNSVIAGRKDGSMIIAEESTAWPMVTHRPEDNGLGFTFKWNMGWMHDFLEYMKLDPYFRRDNHNKMTFGLTYFTSENYVLVLSHDEVVHLKCSMINKMPGIYEDKFSNLKCGYSYMIGHPGKKLLFMGQEFAQWHEWDEKVSLNWELLNEAPHRDMQNFVRGLLQLYRSHPALYHLDNDWQGFEWINANDADRSIFSFLRRDESRKKSLLFVINFTPVAREDYRVGVPHAGSYRLILDETEGLYALRKKRAVSYRAKPGECDQRPFYLEAPLPAYGVRIFEFDETKRPAVKKAAGSKKTATEKVTGAKKPAVKKTAGAKKPATEKAASKKPAAKKTQGSRSASKKTASSAE
ncbi:1,4-alpha-glucan branching protein GlgB [Stomatobaculum longum]|uniref:1,4-alpha-glucan branching protein GlgB n=1 Tax=Stomatobaculum longum TaxID=796942 RepID=UPI0028E19393|nr:1,4-alpha-glucan branching protein GlgB [Stomatobaculum longum]